MSKHVFATSYRTRDDGGRFYTHVHCDHCQAVCMNGTPVHETGCPVAWKDCMVKCKECGTKFYPEERGQCFCDDECYRSYNGFPKR